MIFGDAMQRLTSRQKRHGGLRGIVPVYHKVNSVEERWFAVENLRLIRMGGVHVGPAIVVLLLGPRPRGIRGITGGIWYGC